MRPDLKLDNRKCKCDKRPSYNFPGEKKAVCCSKCKEEKMVNVKHKKCKCGKKNPTYNFIGQKTALCCSLCKEEGMINVVSKRCKCNSDKQPSYNFPGKRNPICCSLCKEEGMENVISKKCKCNKRPSYNFPGEKKAVCCSLCKEKGMVNVRHKKCVLCEEFTSQRKYKWYCFSCFCYTFPDDKIVRRHLIKERAVNELMKESFSHLYPDKISYNKPIGGGSKRRPDWFIDCSTHCIIIECDENRHKSYKEICEKARIQELLKDIAFRHLVVLRFNPDKYKTASGTVKGCFPGRTTKPNAQLRERFAVLSKEINYYLNNQPTELLTEKKFFFDHEDC